MARVGIHQGDGARGLSRRLFLSASAPLWGDEERQPRSPVEYVELTSEVRGVDVWDFDQHLAGAPWERQYLQPTRDHGSGRHHH